MCFELNFNINMVIPTVIIENPKYSGIISFYLSGTLLALKLDLQIMIMCT
jgi:hypothetical protein